MVAETNNIIYNTVNFYIWASRNTTLKRKKEQ
jgi:hypothetical protein